LPNFVAREHVRRAAAFGTLPHPLNWVAVVEIVAPGMVEKNAHYVSDFAASPRCSFQMFKPQLHFDCLDVRQEVVSPTRNDPFAKIALIGFLR